MSESTLFTLCFKCFRTIAVPVSGAHYGPGTGPIHLDGLKCNGSETNLGWCQKKPLDVNTCNHENDAGIICLRKYYESNMFI